MAARRPRGRVADLGSAELHLSLANASEPGPQFGAENAAFRADRVASVRVLVDRSTAGALWVAEVGLAGA